MKLAVIGARGQVGTEVVGAARARGHEVVAIDHDTYDVTDLDSIGRALADAGAIDAVVNTAAMHRVDECEAHPERAVAVNARGAVHVAIAAANVGAAAVYISTDYVFGGAKGAPYVESDAPAPLNVYGATKFAGEELTRLANPRAFIIRIASVFGPAGSRSKGGNFIDRMLAAERAGERPKVRADLTMSPTSAVDAGELLVALLERSAQPGVYHLSNAGSCTWLELADAVFELSGSEIRAEAVDATGQPGAARRPPNSALASERLAAYGLSARRWREALRDYVEARSRT